MRTISTHIQLRVKQLRKAGCSHRVISQKLGISVGTAFKYSKDLVLTDLQQRELRRSRYNKSLNTYSEEKKHEWRQRGGINTHSHFEKLYSRNELLCFIKEFQQSTGRIPTKKDMPGKDSTIRRYFGTWNKAITEAGFNPNPALFAKKHEADDGHICDSYAERIIDDWLTSNHVSHQRSVVYPGSRFRTDFLVGDVYIEYFGLHGNSVKYDKLMAQKLEMIARCNIKLVSIYPDHLFPEPKLDEILGFLVV